MKIVLVGAQGTGKTTLLDSLRKHYELPVIPELARPIVAEIGKPLKEIRRDPKEILDFQFRVLGQQIEYEKMHAKGFIGDRSVIDNFALFIRWCNPNPREFAEYRKLVTDHLTNYPYDIIMFLRPGDFPLFDDGFRTADEKYQHQVDGIILAVLRLLELDYHEVTGFVNERVGQVREAIDAFGKGQLSFLSQP